ncbi:MAG: Na/Pi cotransporter family protein [Geobacter sp.]|nr:Na/Pi cotransporter family protein [Geobacter sp.]
MSYASLWEALGGLGLFILGMKSMSEGLQRLAGEGIRRFLERLASTRLSSAFVGSCLSASLQSSSAAAILLVGFVNAGLVSLYQALGVMLGTGIGTTLAVQFIAFKVSIASQPLIFVGAILKFFCRRRRWVYAGEMLLGAGLVFLGLHTMEMGFVPLTERAIGFGIGDSHFPWRIAAILLGALFAFMLQSGSAAVGIVIAMTGSGLVKYDYGFHMVIGEVLGTTAIAAIATISGTLAAKRMVVIYFLINIAAIILVLLFPQSFQNLVHYITPGVSDTAAPAAAGAAARLLANSHTLFSVLSIVLFLPPLGFFVRSAKVILPGREKGLEFEANCKFIDDRVINTPSLAMLQLRNELRRMSDIAASMYDDVVEQFFRFDAKRTLRINKKEEALDVLQREISGFLAKLSRQPLSTEMALGIPAILSTVNTLEHMGDQNEVIIKCLIKKKENKVIFSSTALAELKNLAVRIGDLVHLALGSPEDVNETILTDARALKDEIDRLQEVMHANHVQRLTDGKCTVMAGVVFSDIIAAFDKVAEYAFSIIKLGRGSEHA